MGHWLGALAILYHTKLICVYLKSEEILKVISPKAEDRKASPETKIDFLISGGRKIHPVEVKSSAYRLHSSLDKFRRRFASKLGESYILYQKDVTVKDGVVHLPLYMAMFL